MCFSSQLLNFNLLKTLTHFIKVRPDEAKLLNPGAHVLVAGEGSSTGGGGLTYHQDGSRIHRYLLRFAFVSRSPTDGRGQFVRLDYHVISSVGPRPSADGGPAD